MAKLFDKIFPDTTFRSPEERVFCDAWLVAAGKVMAYISAGIALVFHPVSLAFEAFLVHDRYRPLLTSGHLVLITMAVLLFLRVPQKLGLGVRTYVMCGQAILVILFAEVLARAWDDHSLHHILLASTGYISIASAMVFTIPYYTVVLPVLMTVVYSGFAFYAMHGSPLALAWSFITTLALICTLGTQQFLRIRALHEAQNEFRAREAIKEAERQRQRRELALASEIQDSLRPAAGLAGAGGFAARYFQLKHSGMGGDWMATRRLPGGELVVLVADATGKGFQAALVVHALQSLWASQLDRDSFDPEAWIRSVNRTLIRMGEQHPHSLTLGLAVVTPTQVSYYSAGHPPLYLVDGDGPVDKRAVSSMLGYGNILGLFPELPLRACVRPLDPRRRSTLLLGTDGVFDKGTRHPASDIRKLIAALDRSGERALADLPADDDKTLILVQAA